MRDSTAELPQVPPDAVVDEHEASRLAEEHGLPPIEVDAALYGETLQRAESVLKWIDDEEHRLTRRHGLLEGRRLYRPVRMLKAWAKKHGAGRNRAESRGERCP